MSLPRKTMISCPKCARKFETVIFDSINTSFAPNVPESIINGDLFNAKCPDCGFVAHLEYNLLYNDMVHGAMIWVIHPETDAYKQRISEIRTSLAFPSDITRIVANVNRLREKVSCLEAGRDDRVVELCKLLPEVQLQEQFPGFRLRDSFFSFLNREETILLYDDQGKEARCDFTDKMYNTVKAAYADALKRVSNAPYQIIDREWAVA